MKRILLFALAQIAVGCVDAEQSEIPSDGLAQVAPSASCVDLTVGSPFEDLRTCAEQGHAGVQYNLGVMYDSGRGITEDDAEAVRWYRLSAEQGHVGAQYNLGVMYASGEGVPEDIVLAYMWWNVAAAQGEEDAQRLKDITEEEMTREQITEAQRLSREWIEEHPPGGN